MKKKQRIRRRYALLLLTIFLALLWHGEKNINYANAAEVEDTYRYPTPRTEEQLRAFWKQSSINYVNQIFVSDPVFAPDYIPAVTNPAYFEPGLKVLNYLRYSIGLNGDITLNSELTNRAQLAADLVVWNNGTDKKQKPSSMTDTQYKQALNYNQQGFGYSLYGDYALNQTFHNWVIQNSFFSGGWNRTLLLSPELNKIGFGLGNFNDRGAFLASQTNVNFQLSGTSEYDIIAYPGKGTFPAELFLPNNAWSVMLNRNTFAIPSNEQVTVSLTRKNDGKTWNISSTDDNTTFIPVIDSGAYLKINTYKGFYNIEFRPGHIRSINGGDQYIVQIHGVNHKSKGAANIRYEVHFANTDSVYRKFPELPYTDFGGAIMLLAKGGEPVSGVRTEIYQQEWEIVSQKPGLTTSKPVGEPVFIDATNSTDTGAVVIQSTKEASYRFQVLSRLYAPDMSYVLSVKEGHPDLGFMEMHKLDAWGKVLTSNGQPIAEMVMSLKDSKGTTQRALTNRLGEYGFPNLIQGETYSLEMYLYNGKELRIGRMQDQVTFNYSGTHMQFPTVRFATVETRLPKDISINVDGINITSNLENPLAILNEHGVLLVQAKALIPYLSEPLQMKYQSGGKLTISGGSNFTLQTGSAMYVKNGEKTNMGAQPYEKGGAFYIPLIFFADALDYNIVVNWSTGQIQLTSIDL